MHPLPAKQDARWVMIERALLVILLASKTLLFLRYAGVPSGYDVSGHLQHISIINWLHPVPPLRAFYYAHHPPLAFLLAKAVTSLGVEPVTSAQTVSFFASLLSFFCLRTLVRLIGMLRRPEGIAFLYLLIGFPLHVYLGFLVGIDSLMFLWASVVLLLSIRIFLIRDKQQARHVVLLFFALCAALFTKYSGVILLGIPLLVSLFRRPLCPRRMLHAYLIASIAILLAFPYYALRYYLPEHTFFFDSAGTYAWVNEIKERRAAYSNPLDFAAHLIRPNEARQPPWLLPTWKGLWMAYDQPRAWGHDLGEVYARIMPVLLLLGAVAHGMRRKTHALWHSFGKILVVLALLELLALICYIHTFPLEGYFNNKTIYVSPASLAFAFLLSGLFAIPDLFPRRLRAFAEPLRWTLMGLLTLFLAANYLLPVF